MFWNYKVVLDQCGSSWGHRIRDKSCIFILWEVLGWQLKPRELSVLLLSPHPPSSALNQDIRGQWLHRLLNTYHFKDRGSLWLRFFRSVIHTWTTQSHNWSTRPVKFFNIHICYNSRVKIREFVNWSVRLYFGLHPLQNYLFNELGWNAESVKGFCGCLVSFATERCTKKYLRGLLILWYFFNCCWAYLNHG